MSDGIYSALSGAVAQQRSLDVVANNVANANTAGFRADRISFREALAKAGTQGPAPDGLRFVSVPQIRTTQLEGSLRETGNPLDMALQGEGWFSVSTPGGERYTRAGNFVKDGMGVLRTRDGHALLAWPEGEAGGKAVEIRVPAEVSSIRVDPDGSLYGRSENGMNPVLEMPLGRLKIVSFGDGRGLEKQGANLFKAAANTPAPAASNAQVSQGYLESGNINAIEGMNELITASRSFDAFQKVIEAFKHIDERTARDLASRG